jgi:glycosyltransferase involved in cell wall biosynthesis
MVSVIVPVLNDAAGIRRCVDALKRQSYPQSRYEVIVVDNGSTDGTAHLLAELGITALSETAERGSYAARNTGLRTAVGTVVAFTDADCVPSERWLEEGVRAMRTERADLVGGNVRFELSARSSGAEIWDAITNMQVEQNIRERQVAKTANLFVHSSVFNAIGVFPGTLRSGGDVAWTGTATRNGFSLVFSDRAEVVHPARRLGRLMAKQFRVGVGQVDIAATTDSPRSAVFRRALRQLAPPTRGLVVTQLATKGQRATGLGLARVWLAAWLCRAATGAGTLAASVKPPTRQGPNS